MKSKEIRNQMIKLYKENGGFSRLDIKKVNDAHREWLRLKDIAFELEKKEREEMQKKLKNN